MRIVSLGLAAACLVTSGAALAARTSAQPGWVAKDVAGKRGAPIDHTMEIKMIRGGRVFVTGWTGATRGPGAAKAYAFVMDDAFGRQWKVDSTKMSRELTAPARRTLAGYLRRNGLPTGKIEFGDHVTAGRGGELLQRPFSRDSGHMRFTVTEPSGHQTRYLIPLNTDELIRGRKDATLFGTPFRDLDTYGQH